MKKLSKAFADGRVVVTDDAWKIRGSCNWPPKALPPPIGGVLDYYCFVRGGMEDLFHALEFFSGIPFSRDDAREIRRWVRNNYEWME